MSLNLNGSSDEIGLTIDALLRPSLPISIGAWIKPDTVKTSGIYHNNKTDSNNRGAWMFLSGTGGSVEIGYGNNGGSASNNRRSKVGSAGVTTAAWQYVSCSIRGATDMDLYRNGSDVGGTYSGTGSGIAYSTLAAGRIGSVSGSNFYDGLVGEVAVWTVSLSAAEHLALAKGTSALKIRPDKIIQYLPLWTLSALDISPLRLSGVSVAGALADHAPVGSPFPVAA